MSERKKEAPPTWAPPRPWKFEDHFDRLGARAADGEIVFLAEWPDGLDDGKHGNQHHRLMSGLRHAIAAVNAHDALVEALRGLVPPSRAPGGECWCHHSRDVTGHGHDGPCLRVREALALAGEKP